MEEKETNSPSLYPTLPQQASAPPLYPVINNGFYNDPDTFRLTEISRIRHEFNFELERYKSLRKE